jgi:ectoine hydroxylase-related dioxygenase (phytanoyl-CoA dioxygenase family)
MSIPTSVTAREIADFYRQNGFAIARRVFVGEELAALDQESRAQISAGCNRTPTEDYLRKPMPDGEERFFRVDWLTDDQKVIHNDSLATAAVHPLVHEVISDVLNGSCTLTSSAMVFKNEGGGPEVSLHRDDFPDRQRFDSRHVVISADVYIDPTTARNGCLKIIPGSHRIEDVTAHIKTNLSHPELVDLEMNPGDVLFHDGELLHGSAATERDATLRRILYYVWQCPDWVEREGYVPGLRPPRTWIAESIRLTQHLFDMRAASLRDLRDGFRVPPHWRDAFDSANLTPRPYPTWADEEYMEELRKLFDESSGPEWL